MSHAGGSLFLHFTMAFTLLHFLEFSSLLLVFKLSERDLRSFYVEDPISRGKDNMVWRAQILKLDRKDSNLSSDSCMLYDLEHLV